MEPVFIVLGLAAIISATIIKSKKLRLERERMHLAGQSGESLNAGNRKAAKAKEFLERIHQAGPRNNELKVLEGRLQNIETIVTDANFSSGKDDAETKMLILQKLEELSKRMEQLESKEQELV